MKTTSDRRINRFLLMTFRARYLDPLLIIFVTFTAHLRISFDGILYLASAKALGNPEVVTEYHWIREPLYPLILKFVKIFLGSSDTSLVFVQITLVVVGMRLLANSVLPKDTLIASIPTFLVVFNSITIGYVGAVLQQSLFLFMLCLIAILGLIAIDNNKGVQKKEILLVLAISTLAALTSIFMLVPILGVIFAALLFSFRKRAAWSHGIRKAVEISAVALLSFTLVTVCWSVFKANQLQNNPEPEFPPWIWSYSSPPYTPDGYEKYQAIGPLLGLGQYLNSPWSDENGVFSVHDMQLRCGLISQEPVRQFSAVREFITPSCKPYLPFKFLVAFKPTSNLIVATILTFGFVLSILAFFRNRIEMIVAAPGLFLIMFYWSQGAGLSRYTFPAIGVFAIFLGAFIFNSSINKTIK